ncbi:Metastasis suppressor protein 1 [Sparganum proliferum]
MRPKAPLSRGEIANVVYRVQCSSCEANYVGETGKRLQTRMSEHARAVRRMDQLSPVAEHCAASGHTFAFQNAEILGRGTDQTAKETLEAWHTVPTSINRCTILPAAYQALRVRFNQRNQRQEVRTTSTSEHSSRPSTDDGGQQADKGDTGNGPATTEVHTGRGKRTTITRNAGQAQQMRAMQTRTYFTFDGTIYEQVKGTPMGSPISGFIAEAVLQRLESLVYQHHRPKFWARYVDDTFVVIERDQVLTFQEHFNAVFPDIQFTMEEEEKNQVPFLDVLVCRKDCGELKTKVFRKATNTMQVLNFNSNHPISHKRSCVRTLYRRVETHCSEPEDKIAELQYIRRVFKANDYPRNFVDRCIRKRDERPNHADTKSWRALPYVKKVSEAVGRLLAPLEVGVAHRPEATIRRLIMKPKDPLPRLETSGVVYRIWCSCGQSNYVGETGRQLRTRMAEHAAAVRRNDASSQVAAHSTRSGHTFKFDEAEILARGDNRDLAIETIELLLQSKYDETENRLGHAQVLQLLKPCLRTYFTFDGTIYEQVKGTPMGSPIPGFIAEAVLQRLESLVYQHHRPKFWARYVDDTFVVIERDQVLTFQEHFNAVFPDIQFTMEEEEKNQVPFLDVLRGSAKEMEKMVMRAFLLAICLDLGHCEKVELFLQQNRNFFSFYRFTEAPISATSNQSLSKGSDTSPCLQPTFCYQVMSVRRVAMIESQMSNGSAAAIFYPQNASLSPVALSYVLQEKTSPKLPEGVHQLKEYVIPQDIGQFRLLLFSNDIGRVETVGQIVGPDGPPDLSKLELRTFLNRPNTSRVVYVSGRMETHSFWLTLQFPSRPQFTMSSLVQWEDFIGKSSKLNASLTTTIQCLAGFLEAFQKISDIAQGSNFGLRDLGMAMTRFCLRQRGVESRLRTFNSQLGDCLIAPLTDRLEEWKRTVNQLDRDTVKELRKARGELQRATAEAEKCKKRLRRKDSTTTMLAFAHEEPSSVDVSCYSASGTSSSVQANFVQQDLLCKQRALESLERNCLKRAVVEERRRFTELTTCLEPVLAKVMSDDVCGVSLGPVEGAYSIRLGPFLLDDTGTCL